MSFSKHGLLKKTQKPNSFYSLLFPILFCLIHYCFYSMISSSKWLYGTLLKVHLEIEIRSTVFFTTLEQKIVPFAEIGPVRPHHYLSCIFRFMVELSFQPTSQLFVHLLVACYKWSAIANWCVRLFKSNELLLPLPMAMKPWPDLYLHRNKGKPEHTNRQWVDRHFFLFIRGHSKQQINVPLVSFITTAL